MTKDEILDYLIAHKDEPFSNHEVFDFWIKAVKENPDALEQALVEMKSRKL